MTINTYQFILDNLTSCKDSIRATKLYLEHQLSLPEHHRVAHDDDESMQLQLDEIKNQYFKYADAIKELQAARKILTSSGVD